MKLEDYSNSLAISGSTLLVGVPEAYHHGAVHVYNNNGGKWVETQTIQQQGVNMFGWSVTIDGSHMAVSADDEVFTYQQDATSNKWIKNGHFTVQSSNYIPIVSIQKDTLVATLTDYRHHPTVSGYVYKLSTNNNNNGSVTSWMWNHRAVLTTKTDPLTSVNQEHTVSVEGRYAFIGRCVEDYDDGVGKVFVYDMADISDSRE